MNSLITINDGIALLDPETSARIADFERKMKEIKEAEDELKKGILKVETDEITISYIATTDRETFDSKKFRAEHQDLYDEFVKISPVKASVRIKVK